MSKSTHEDLQALSSSSAKPPSPSRQANEPAWQSLRTKRAEISSMQQTLKMLDELHYSPRSSTIASILQYAREQQKEVPR